MIEKKLVAIILCFLILITSIGCSKNIDIPNQEIEKNKGGYVEEIIKVSDDIKYVFDLVKLNNGNIVVAAADKDNNSRLFVSDNTGLSWVEKKINHLNFEEEIKGRSLTLQSNGNILISYILEGINGENIRYAILNEVGQVNEINLEIKQEKISNEFNGAPIFFISLNNGDLVYLTSDGSEIVQIDGETFKEKYRYKTEFFSDFISNTGDKLIVTSMTSVNEYDITTGAAKGNLTKLENEIINSDISKKPINAQSHERFYYSSFSEGLFYYDLDKNESKLLIKDSKNINNPNSSIKKLLELENNTFLMLITDEYTGINKLIKYTYDSNYIQDNESNIIIYSLTENKVIRNRISMYEAENPNISIKYEVGVTNNYGVEVSDAIKTLNTEILAGKGPDIILLDGLPINSFIKSGALIDLSDIISEYELFEGIVKSYEIDGKLYQLPLSISIPMIIGEKDIISKIADLESLLAIIKENKDNSQNRIFEKLGAPEEFISSLYYIYGNNLVNNNKINKEQLNKFMSISEELYLISKIKEDNYLKEEFGDMAVGSMHTGNKINQHSLVDISVPEMSYSKKPPLLAYGGISNIYNIEILFNMLINKEFMSYKILTKENENIFLPNNKVGININSKNKDLSKHIINNFINQTISDGNITINKELFINRLQIDSQSIINAEYNESNKHYVKHIVSDFDENGTVVEFPEYWANEDDINGLVNKIDKLNVEPEINNALLNEITRQFKKVIEEEIDINTAIVNIEKKLEIYLLERTVLKK